MASFHWYHYPPLSDRSRELEQSGHRLAGLIFGSKESLLQVAERLAPLSTLEVAAPDTFSCRGLLLAVSPTVSPTTVQLYWLLQEYPYQKPRVSFETVVTLIDLLTIDVRELG